MRIDIRPVDQVTPQEWAQIDEISRLTFGAEPGEPETVLSEMEWGPVDWQMMGWEGEGMVSGVCLLAREIRVGGKPLRVGGVGGVMTHPAHQRKGYAAQLLARGHQFLREEAGVAHSLLVCAEKRVAYYAKSGYQLMTAPMLVAYKGGRVHLPGPVMVACLAGEPWPQGEVDLQGNPW